MTINWLRKNGLMAAMGLGLALSITSCDKQFEELNTNPNQSSSTATSFLLTNAEKTMMDLTWDEWFNSRRGNQLAQYWASNQYSNESRYQFRVGITNDYWSLFYARSLQDLQEIIDLNSGDNAADYVGFGKNENQIAIAQILQTWLFQNMTDCWGPIPYSQALKGAEFPLPNYDSQEDVYVGMLATLDAAIAAIDESDNSVQGDVIYNGNMTQWKKFANALKMRVALRMADTNRGAEAQAAFEAAAPNSFTSNADNAIFPYQSSDPNINPQAEDYRTRNDFAASNTMVDELLRLNDPRVGFYYEPASATGTYVGEVYGLSESNAALTTDAEVSQRSQSILANDAPGIFLDYAQICFMKAEAAARGWGVSGSAEDHYNAGIEASMNYWDDGSLSATDISNYIAQADVDYNTLIGNGETWQQVIGRQKWIALYMQGVQGWAEWRRLDFGILQSPADGTLDGTDIPTRMKYPLDEQTLNAESYADGVIKLGGADNQDTKLWWDVN
ncbi:SusD/RagB family nutrient-binding outer membrane lipoprotein [Saprospira sp. CCB-QB6]|uniref:SusD/RagB family nutrient-binding outer membrane lipoprotein n=1 Tax=Saprospira sp. CCB-QB6 TaxID=3023936 RepID=UPI00234ADE02|nr:SusD/RagB family nutrient-binding outer membrane lipoprotein [Saprospira sp. CCB-QB6]WCL83047.1 SusD/RagB family nutrient-binding outer membrane lipoprotein [Saprospira sp. CCB-QB6]